MNEIIKSGRPGSDHSGKNSVEVSGRGQMDDVFAVCKEHAIVIKAVGVGMGSFQAPPQLWVYDPKLDAIGMWMNKKNLGYIGKEQFAASRFESGQHQQKFGKKLRIVFDEGEKKNYRRYEIIQVVRPDEVAELQKVKEQFLLEDKYE